MYFVKRGFRVQHSGTWSECKQWVRRTCKLSLWRWMVGDWQTWGYRIVYA